MDPLQIGTKLLCRYRVERLWAENNGTLLYEATDTVRARTVCVRIIRQEALADADSFASFQSGAHDPSVVDFGNVGGLPFYVTTEWECLPQVLIPVVLDLDLDDDGEDEDVTLLLETRAAL